MALTPGKQHTLALLALSLLAIGISGCGGNSYRASSTITAQTSNPNVIYTGSDSGSTTSGATGTQAPQYFPIQSTGYSSVSVSVTTGSILKVRFIPAASSMIRYNHLGVYITVGSTTHDSGMLRTGADGMGPPDASAVLDFSSAVAGQCGDSGCRQSVTIQVSHPNYDYWCLNYLTNCPWNRVSDGHDWGGMLMVQTDDTRAI